MAECHSQVWAPLLLELIWPRGHWIESLVPSLSHHNSQCTYSLSAMWSRLDEYQTLMTSSYKNPGLLFSENTETFSGVHWIHVHKQIHCIHWPLRVMRQLNDYKKTQELNNPRTPPAIEMLINVCKDDMQKVWKNEMIYHCNNILYRLTR